MPIIPRANDMEPRVTQKALANFPLSVCESAFSIRSAPLLSGPNFTMTSFPINKVHYGQVRMP